MVFSSLVFLFCFLPTTLLIYIVAPRPEPPRFLETMQITESIAEDVRDAIRETPLADS
jgi:hypothetical protein